MAEVASAVIPRVLYVPNTIAAQGMGHLQRCRKAVQEQEDSAIWLCTDPELLGGNIPFEASRLAEWAAQTRILPQVEDGAIFPLVVLDFQKTPVRLLEFWKSRASVLIGWDEGGAGRSRFPFLVDSLPHQTLPLPNVRLPGLLGLAPFDPVFENRYSRPVKNVLVVFGGADPAGLTRRFLRFHQKQEQRAPRHWNLTVIQGPLAKFEALAGVAVVSAPDGLGSWLARSDLVITSWGLTALESLAAGTPVLLFNPTAYHEKLTKQAGLVSFGVRRPRKARFEKALGQAGRASRDAAQRLLPPAQSAGSYFSAFTGTQALCPVCRTAGHQVFVRTEHKSFHKCSSCSMEFLSVYQLPPKEYSDAYFFEDYQTQYGKTYLEDFPHIESLGAQRLEFLRRLGRAVPELVFDVGCAFGPFLSAVHKAGSKPFGLDIASSAVKHVTEVLGFPAVQGSWLDFDWNRAFPDTPKPSLLTMWYVIEHFPDVDAVLRKTSQVLTLGGVFAFGTPNGLGITRRFRGRKFWEDSPDDHFTVWNRSNARKILGRYGFRVLGFRNTGQHPERFPGLETRRGWAFRLVRWLSNVLSWGDTFEVYAQKIRELA